MGLTWPARWSPARPCRLDLAFGQEASGGTALALFRSIASGEGAADEPEPGVCDAGFFPVGLGGADFNGDGADELLVGEPGAVIILDAKNVGATTLPAGACVPGAFLPIDLNTNGDLDLYVGCQRALD